MWSHSQTCPRGPLGDDSTPSVLYAWGAKSVDRESQVGQFCKSDIDDVLQYDFTCVQVMGVKGETTCSSGKTLTY